MNALTSQVVEMTNSLLVDFTPNKINRKMIGSWVGQVANTVGRASVNVEMAINAVCASRAIA